MANSLFSRTSFFAFTFLNYSSFSTKCYQAEFMHFYVVLDPVQEGKNCLLGIEQRVACNVQKMLNRQPSAERIVF